ncbi:MAG TPA: hypothetical protein VMV94_18000 [Phycisphaerae bacterium]|nr:hypothetical protein [Phycisphaerae bacterium]
MENHPDTLISGGRASLLESLAAALRFLLPLGRRRAPAQPATLSRATSWIVPLGLLIGLLWAGTFRVTWKLYGEIATVRVVPALMIVLIESLFTGLYLVLGLARTVHLLAGDRPLRPEPYIGDAGEGGPAPNSQPVHGNPLSLEPLSPIGTLAMCLVVLCQWVLITSIPWESPWWPAPNDWRHHFNFLYPAPLYRPLLLAPIWGRWGILVAATIGRTARHVDSETVGLSQAMSPARLLRQSVLPIALTAVYCSRGGNLAIGIIMSMLVFGVTYVVAVIMARRGGGQSRQSLYAAGQIAQLVFLALCRAFWLFIHR